jgi:hypothetical protein
MSAKKRPTAKGYVSSSVYDGRRVLTREQNLKFSKAFDSSLAKAKKPGTSSIKIKVSSSWGRDFGLWSNLRANLQG